MHVEYQTSDRTALSMTAGLNRLFSGYYLQAGGKFFFHTDGIGPYAHVTGTYGSGRTDHAVWQTAELGLALGNSWRVSEKLRMHLEVGYAVGDGTSHVPGGHVGTPAAAPSGRYVIGWRLLLGG